MPCSNQIKNTMEATDRATKIFDEAKETGLVNPVTGDGMPTWGMVVDAIQAAEDSAVEKDSEEKSKEWKAVNDACL